MSNIPTSFTPAPEVLALGVRVKCFVMRGMDNTGAAAAFDEYRLAEIARIRNGLSEELLQSDPVLAGFRTLHEKIGKTGKRWISSPENLRRMLLANPVPPSINKIVDIYNLVSLQSGLALGAHDLDRIEGNISLRLTTGTEKFHPIGGKEPEKVAAGEYAYCDDSNEVICRLEVRQVEKTKVLPTTTNAFFIVQGNTNTPDDHVDRTISRLVDMLRQHTAGIFEAV